MAGEEYRQRQRLIALHEKRFGPTIPLIRRWTPFFCATFQVVLGGALVFAAGVLIGSGSPR